MSYDITTNIDYECSICFEYINIDDFILYDEFLNNYNDISSLSSIKTHCGHFFHSKCLYINNLKYSTCPICRQSFPYNNITDNSNNITDNSNNITDNITYNITDNSNNNIYINITDYSDNSDNYIIDYSQYFLIKFKISSCRTRYIYIHKRNLLSLLFILLILLLFITSIVLLILEFI